MGWRATGVWHGHYTFDPQPECPDLPEQVGFEMRLQQSWLFGSLTGEVRDEPPHGVPGCGTIEGRVSGDQIEFLKEMPDFYVWYDGRSMPLDEYLTKFDLRLDVPPSPLPLRYVGRYLSASGELTGTWRYAVGKTTLLCDGNFLDLEIPAGGGRWSARRVPGK
jgi:hypothetical protein